MTDAETAKRAAGRRAAEEISDGQVVGLGSGSTAAHAIRELGGRVDAGLDVRGVPTSHQAREEALDAGIPLTSLDAVEAVHIAIDGADQLADGDAIKGGGGAHAREKVVDAAAERLLIVVDPSKEADALDAPVPVSVLPDARTTVADAVRAAGGEPTLRRATEKSGPVVTDNGNLILDCEFGRIDDPAALAATLSGIPGAVAHGLFVGLIDAVCIGSAEGASLRRVEN